MWQRRHGGPEELLRIGACALERWFGPSDHLALVGRHPLVEPSSGLAQDIEAALRVLFPTTPAHPVTILLESVHLPVVHLEVGASLWSHAQVEPLLIHRLNAQYADRQHEAPKWSSRLDYRPGDVCGLGYGMSDQARSALVMACDAAGIACHAVRPAFAWGLERFRKATHVPNGTGWWIWSEQDRLLVARVEQRQVVALNAGVPLPATPEQMEAIVDAECFRSGRGRPNDAIEVATWALESIPASAQTSVKWTTIAAPAPLGAQSPRWQTSGLRSATS